MSEEGDLLRAFDVEVRLTQLEASVTAELARMVIHRSELNGRLFQLEARMLAVEEAEARMLAAEDRLRPEARHQLLTSVMAEVRQAVADLPERLQELEDVAAALEKHLRLRRRPPDARPKALPPAPPQTSNRRGA